MPKIISVGTFSPPNTMDQETTVEFAKELFQDSYEDIARIFNIFQNGQIEKRNFSMPLDWFKKTHTFQEKNDLYISCATQFGMEAIKNCIQPASGSEEQTTTLKQSLDFKEIDAIFFISSSGISTPSIEARIMNQLPFSPHTKRIPIWGLGCAGGAAGLSRAYEYCLAFPQAKVLVLSVELCSLTFQSEDKSKSNLIGTSLFADGVAVALVVGDEVEHREISSLDVVPRILDAQSTLMPDSEDVMGWDVKDEGLHVIFSKDIPTIIQQWLYPNAQEFLSKNSLDISSIDCFVAHPGGRKVLEAYEAALGLTEDKTSISREVLKGYGNMSSATVLYVLKRFLEAPRTPNEYGLVTALGPGFSSELLLLQWES